tara:strand:- start:681 stop:1133 length:453 start_codon:yes stop_codon:yes gene_type:complete
MTLKISNNRLNKYDARQKLATAIDTASYFTVNTGALNFTTGALHYVCTIPKAATFVSGKVHLSGDEGTNGVVTVQKLSADTAALSGGTDISADVALDAGAAAFEAIAAKSDGSEDCAAGDNILLDNSTNIGNNVVTNISLTFKLVDDPTQ